MSDFEKTLAKDLAQGREYREAYSESFSNEYIATQIQVLRKQRDLTQAELGQRIGSNQGRISVYEDEDYGKWGLDTLRKLAAEFGVWLRVSFEEYGTLVRETATFSPQNLQRQGFEEDLQIAAWRGLVQVGNVGNMADSILLWQRGGATLGTLARWLQGVDLPGFDPALCSPAEYLLESVRSGDDRLRDAVLAGLARLLRAGEDVLAAIIEHRTVYFQNLFAVVAEIGPSLELQEALDKLYAAATQRHSKTGVTGMGYEGDSGLLSAMAGNQVDDRWDWLWQKCLDGGEHPADFEREVHPFFRGGATIGLRGLLRRKKNDYWLKLAAAVHAVELRFLLNGKGRVNDSPNVMDELGGVMDVILDYRNELSGARLLMEASIELAKSGKGSWCDQASAAWAAAVQRRSGWIEGVTAGDTRQQRKFTDLLASGLAYFTGWYGAASNRLPIQELDACREASADASRRVIPFPKAA